MSETLHVKISNPEKVFFDGTARSVSSKNDTGPFDILPDHTKYVSLLHDATVTVIDEAGASSAYQVRRGLLSVDANAARIFVDL